MKTQHTPEPWYAGEGRVINEPSINDLYLNGRCVASCTGYTCNVNQEQLHIENHANAQRIAQCVNAFGKIKELYPSLYADPSKLEGFIKAADNIEQWCALKDPEDWHYRDEYRKERGTDA